MRTLALLGSALACAGCQFGVQPVDVEMGTPLDGDVGDANVEMMPPVDANLFDFASSPNDLHREVPDGALPRKTGYPCSLAAECDNGFCIDNFCCDDLCDPFDPANQCRACNVPGAEGHCVFAQDNTDPRGLCDAEAASTCGRDGLCDGKGGCRLFGAGTSCGASSCSANSFNAPPMCDGQGHCDPSKVSADCAPYDCVAGACGVSCSSTGGCVSPAVCDGFGLCDGKLGLGAFCGNPKDCASGFCAQGVCCATDCTGACRSCALPNAKGLCVLVADGADPFNDCGAFSRSSCKQDGVCDGAGACRLWSSLTVCAPASCSGDSSVATRLCSGNGDCVPVSPVSCYSSYTCNPVTGGCFTEPCTDDNQCAGGKLCGKNGKCK